jgi:DNA polymerase-3 subunit beta
VLVPRKAIVELGRLLEGQEAVAFQQVENHLVFSTGGRTLASKMIEGQFPAFEKVVGVAGERVARLGREPLTQALRRVSLLSSERSRAVRFQLGAGRLEIFASSPELGEAKESLAADYAGEALEIGFNAQYILEFLGAAGVDDVNLELKDSESQGVFRPAGDGETDYRYVVMPMRL